MGFLKFPMKWLLCIKTFLFQKKMINFKREHSYSSFQHMVETTIFCLNLLALQFPNFASDGPKKTF